MKIYSYLAYLYLQSINIKNYLQQNTHTICRDTIRIYCRVQYTMQFYLVILTSGVFNRLTTLNSLIGSPISTIYISLIQFVRRNHMLCYIGDQKQWQPAVTAYIYLHYCLKVGNRRGTVCQGMCSSMSKQRNKNIFLFRRNGKLILSMYTQHTFYVGKPKKYLIINIQYYVSYRQIYRKANIILFCGNLNAFSPIQRAVQFSKPQFQLFMYNGKVFNSFLHNYYKSINFVRGYVIK